MEDIKQPAFRLLTISNSPVVPREDIEAAHFLRKPAQQVTSLQEAEPVIAGMKAWCELHAQGIAGLSAPQLGASYRIAFIWYQGLHVVMINPDVVYQKGSVLVYEGCLSLPGQRYQVRRPKIAKVQYLDENWQLHSLKGHDTTAMAIMHEMDHLDGVLIDLKGKD
ncbi:MAG: peptide deformylase [Dehalococcoidales bacterium]|nr:peptide deformylase [Dehalococcoidales bacterium]